MFVYAFAATLFALAVLVVWPSSRIQHWLLFLFMVSLRLLLTAAILAMAGAAVVPPRLLEILLGEDLRQVLPWLRNHIGEDNRLTFSVIAFVLALIALPCLIGLDFARALAGHSSWLRRLHSRMPEPGTTAPMPAAIPSRSYPERPTVPTTTAQQRRSLDELLG